MCKLGDVILVCHQNAGPTPLQHIHFVFYLHTDTAFSLSEEMFEQLSLEDHDVYFIADFIDYLIIRILPFWIPFLGEYSRVQSSQKLQLDHASPDLGFYFLPLSTSSESEESALPEIMGENMGSKNVNTYAHAADCEIRAFKEFFHYVGFKIQSQENNCNPLNLGLDQDAKLKAELDDIEFQYQKKLQELTRKKQEAIETAKKKWMEKGSK